MVLVVVGPAVILCTVKIPYKYNGNNVSCDMNFFMEIT